MSTGITELRWARGSAPLRHPGLAAGHLGRALDGPGRDADHLAAPLHALGHAAVPDGEVAAAAEEPDASVHEVRGLHRLRPVRARLPGAVHLPSRTRSARPTPRRSGPRNGQPIKLHVTVFDIDMSLCCYCNLCTYPCPTDCIYMTPEYEFATSDLTQHLYRFAKKDAKFLTEDPKKAAAPKGRTDRPRRRRRRSARSDPRRGARPAPVAGPRSK